MLARKTVPFIPLTHLRKRCLCSCVEGSTVGALLLGVAAPPMDAQGEPLLLVTCWSWEIGREKNHLLADGRGFWFFGPLQLLGV